MRLAYSDDAVVETVDGNMASFPGSQAFVSHATLLQTIFSILLNSAEENIVSEHLIATIANFVLNKSNIPFLITGTSCSGFVFLA